jgi:hypothetical protein
MRVLLVILAFLTTNLTLSGTARLSAQTTGERRVIPPPVTSGVPLLRDAPGAAWHMRVLTAISGAAVGAGIGFFSSQIFRGDWDEVPGRDEVDRSAWAAVGGSFGFAIGFSFPIAGRGRSPDPGMRLPGGRFQIRAADFESQGVNSADDIVRLVRPEWLIERGVNIIGEAPGQGLEVYLDDVRLGTARTLRDVSADIVQSMHFFDPGAATFRFGAGHSHGVILIIARNGRSDSAPRP